MTKRSFSGFEETQPSKQQREDTIIYSKMCELYGELLNDDGDNLPAIKEEERSETHEFFQCCQSKHEKEAIEGFHLVGFFKTCQCASFELRLAPDEASTVMDHVKNERRQKKFNDLFKIQPRFIQSDVLINRGTSIKIASIIVDNLPMIKIRPFFRLPSGNQARLHGPDEARTETGDRTRAVRTFPRTSGFGEVPHPEKRPHCSIFSLGLLDHFLYRGRRRAHRAHSVCHRQPGKREHRQLPFPNAEHWSGEWVVKKLIFF